MRSNRLAAIVKEACKSVQNKNYSGELDVPIPQAFLTDLSTLANAYLAAHPADDDEPITAEWLLSLGAELRPDHVHGTPDQNYRLARDFTLWQFNDTDEWLMESWDTYPLRTRGDVRRLCEALSIDLDRPTNR